MSSVQLKLRVTEAQKAAYDAARGGEALASWLTRVADRAAADAPTRPRATKGKAACPRAHFHRPDAFCSACGT